MDFVCTSTDAERVECEGKNQLNIVMWHFSKLAQLGDHIVYLFVC